MVIAHKIERFLHSIKSRLKKLRKTQTKCTNWSVTLWHVQIDSWAHRYLCAGFEVFFIFFLFIFFRIDSFHNAFYTSYCWYSSFMMCKRYKQSLFSHNNMRPMGKKWCMFCTQDRVLYIVANGELMYRKQKYDHNFVFGKTILTKKENKKTTTKHRIHCIVFGIGEKLLNLGLRTTNDVLI